MAFNYSITIQEVTETRSSTGAVTESWGTHITTWADIEQVSGSEQFNSDMLVYNDVKRFMVHYEAGKNVTPKMRISYDSAYYYITSVNHKNRLKTELMAVRNDDE